MINIDQMQSMLEATVSTVKDMKENPGEHSEELLSYMETNDCEHKGTKIKDNFTDNIIAEVKERFPEKYMQVLKDFHTILDPTKLPGTAAGI